MNKKLLKENLSELLNNYPIKSDDIVIEKPKNKDHGHFSSPLAFSLTKPLKKAPKIIAEEIIETLLKSKKITDMFEISNINGYLNFTYKDTVAWDAFKLLLNKPYIYQINQQSILLEYVSANPTGPLHIGHGRWAVIGSVIENLLKETKHQFKTEFYINDAGSQIKKFYDSVSAKKNNKPIPEDGYHGSYISEIAAEDVDPITSVINKQKETLSKLNVSFDSWFSEKTLHENKSIELVLEKLETIKLTYINDNAIWFKSTEFGDEKDRVLVKSDGSYTYFLVDIAYHHNKINRGFNHLISIFGADHHGYIKRLNAAVEALSSIEKTSTTLTVILGQLVNLFRDQEPVRMSKRTGDMITLNEVIDEIGVDATRYYLIEKSYDTTIDFDLDLAKKQSSENPVYYIQYAHARMCSILRKFEELESNISDQHINLKFNQTEKDLITLALDFHSTIEEVTLQLTPYKLAQYLQALAKTCHAFYETCPILKSTEDEQQKRLIIIKQTKAILAYGLNLLGITAPTKM